MEKPGIAERQEFIANNAKAYRILEELVASYVERPSTELAILVLNHAQDMIDADAAPGRKEAIEKALRPFRAIQFQQK